MHVIKSKNILQNTLLIKCCVEVTTSTIISFCTGSKYGMQVLGVFQVTNIKLGRLKSEIT